MSAVLKPRHTASGYTAPRYGFRPRDDAPEARTIRDIAQDWRIVAYRRPDERCWRYCGELHQRLFQVMIEFPGGVLAPAPDPDYVMLVGRLTRQRGQEPPGALVLFARLARTR